MGWMLFCRWVRAAHFSNPRAVLPRLPVPEHSNVGIVADENFLILETDAEQIVQKADQDYNKFRAQSDLSTRLQKAAGPEGAASPAGLHQWSKQLGTPRVVGGTSRLAQALGPDGAEAVQKLAAEGRGRAVELASQAATGDVIKKAAVTGAAGAAGAGAVGYPLYRILGGMHGH